jgi:steroid 5-alpha reductase family enzyme
MALGSDAFVWWMPLGGLTVLALFLYASIPMMEKRQARKPAYADYQRRVSKLLPLPPKR